MKTNIAVSYFRGNMQFSMTLNKYVQAPIQSVELKKRNFCGTIFSIFIYKIVFITSTFVHDFAAL